MNLHFVHKLLQAATDQPYGFLKVPRRAARPRSRNDGGSGIDRGLRHGPRPENIRRDQARDRCRPFIPARVSGSTAAARPDARESGGIGDELKGNALCYNSIECGNIRPRSSMSGSIAPPNVASFAPEAKASQPFRVASNSSTQSGTWSACSKPTP